MEFNIYEAKAHFSSIIQSLVDGKEEIVYISKNGKPVAQITLIGKKNSKRLGAAKKELKDFELSLEDFNNIPIDDFYGGEI